MKKLEKQAAAVLHQHGSFAAAAFQRGRKGAGKDKAGRPNAQAPQQNKVNKDA